MNKKYALNTEIILKHFFSIRQKSYLNKMLILLFFLFIYPLAFGQSTSCNAELISNRGNIRNSPLDGTYYSLTLTNKGTATDAFTLNTLDVNKTCQNSDDTATSNNVILNNSILDSNLNPIKKLTINSGESIIFYIHITIPNGTPLNKWSCLQILATSKNCPNYNLETILHTFTIDTSIDK